MKSTILKSMLHKLVTEEELVADSMQSTRRFALQKNLQGQNDNMTHSVHHVMSGNCIDPSCIHLNDRVHGANSFEASIL
jgi:hypothetical protein